MEETDFYIIELSGNRRYLSYNEIHKVRKDILLYFDENIGEPISIFMPDGMFNLDYWKYISINFDTVWAESVSYKRLIEEGCLALLNGIILELLDQPITSIMKTWKTTPVDKIISYLHHYKPQTEKLVTAKSHLLKAFEFINKTDDSDIDVNGMLKGFDVSITGKWFEVNILQEYYRWKIEKNCTMKRKSH